MPNKLTCVVAGALFLLASAAQAEAVQPARSRGHVVLLSNLLGAPGTFGLYFMANKLEKRLGVETNVRWWGAFSSALQRVRAADPSAVLVLVGHSQGANRAAETAQILATRGVPRVVGEVRKALDGAVQTNSSTAPASSNRRPRDGQRGPSGASDDARR